MAQVDLGVGAIGGKDSMSGSFEQLDVPPTLVCFATAVGSVDSIVIARVQGGRAAASCVCRAGRRHEDRSCPTSQGLLEAFDLVESSSPTGRCSRVSTPGYGGLAEALFKMCVGNRIGLAS